MNPMTNFIKKWITLSTLLTILFTQNIFAQIQSATSGDWHATTTWVGGILPSASDEVEILAGHTVTISSPVTLDLPGNLSVIGNLSLLSVFQGSAVKTVEAGGILDLSGTINGSGDLIVEDGGTLNFANAGSTYFFNTIRNHGTANWNTGERINPCNATGTFINETDGELVLGGSGTRYFGRTNVINHGLITKNTNANIYINNDGQCGGGGYFDNTNPGIVNITSGILYLEGAGTHSGVFNNTGILVFGATQTLTMSGNVTGGGDYIINGTTVIDIPYSFAATAVHLYGTLTGSGNKTVPSGSVINSAGTFSGTGELIIADGATLNFTNPGSTYFFNTIRNHGTANWNTGERLNPCNATGTFINETDGKLVMGGANTRYFGRTNLINHGLITKNTNANIYINNDGQCGGGGYFDNTSPGIVNVTSGILYLEGSGTHSGVFNNTGILVFGSTQTLTTSGNVTGGGDFIINGTTIIDIPYSFAATAVHLNGTLTGSGNKTVPSGSVINSAGTFSGTGELIIADGVTLNFTNPGSTYFFNTIRNHGTANWNTGERINPCNATGTFINETDGELVMGGANTRYFGRTNLINHGLITKNTNANIYINNDGQCGGGGYFDNTSPGIVNVTSGILYLEGSGTHSGVFNNTGILVFGSTQTLTTSGNVTGGGDFIINGTTIIDIPYSFAATAIHLNGTLTGSGNKTVSSGSVINSAGTFSGTGELIIADGAILNFTNPGSTYFFNTIRNHGTANWNTGERINPCNATGTFINETDGELVMGGANTRYFGRTNLINHGLITKNTNANIYINNDGQCGGGGYFDNTSPGIVNVTSGILYHEGAGTHSGVFNNTGILVFGATQTLTTSGNVTGGGDYIINGTTVIDIPYTFAATTIHLNGTLTGSGNKTVPFGSTINSAGTFSGTGELIIADGAILNFTNAGSTYFFNTIRNHGTANWNTGERINPCIATGTFINETDGELVMGGANTRYFGRTNLINHGLITKNTNANIYINNDGQCGGAGYFENSGTLEGIGYLDVSAGPFTHTGSCSPGNSIGQLTLGVSNLSNGTLYIGLASASGPGTGHDRLTINGNFTATGTLNVSVEGGYNPPLGTSFEIVSATGAISGEFTTINLPAGMEDFIVTYNAQTILITRGTPPPPVPGEALVFDGIDDYISITDNSAFDLTESLTVEVWVNPSEFSGGYQEIINKRECMVSSTNIFQMEYNSSLNSLGFHYSPTNAVWYGVTVPLLANLPLNTWTHLAGTLSQEGNDVLVKLYVNGTLAATNTIINSQFADGNNDSPIYIGQTGQCPGWFKGQLDEIRIWNTDRTQTEIESAMGCHLTGSEVGLIACYGFDQGINGGNNTGVTILVDCTSNNLDGTLHNFALTGATSNWIAPGAELTGTCECEDADLDTYTDCAGDCDDSNPNIHPGATEVCNGLDDDCDGLTDEGCMIGHWKFNNNFNDETTNNTAIESGGVVFDDGVGCEPLEATQYDGVDDHIAIGNLSLLENASALSVSVWVKKEDNTNYAPGFVGKWRSSGEADNTFILYNGGWGTDNKGHFAVQFNDNSEAGIAGSVDLPIGEWTHLVGVWNSSDGFIGLYKNGVLEASSLGNGTGKLLDYSTNFSAKIGAWGVLHGAYTLMKGGLDNVRIYSDALDASEVLVLYNLENLECDDDGDTYTEAEGDCDDSNPDVNPGATEICNTLDDDCDGEIDEGGICLPDIESDLVGHWLFNGNLEDETPNSNTGNGSGGVQYVNGVCGNANGALLFDGIDDNVVIADHPSYAFDLNPFSVTYWISTVQVPGIESVIMMKNNGNNSDGIVTFLNLTGNGNVSGRLSGGQDVSSTGILLNDGSWHHIVYTREGTTQRIFVDGTLNNTANLPLVNATTPYAIVLGLNSLFYGGFYEQYAGKLDNFRLYSRALSGSDVTALYDTESACPDLDLDGFTTSEGDCDDNNADVHPGADEICNGVDDDCDGTTDEPVLLEGLVAYYPFSGNTNDESGLGNHAVSFNATLTTDRYGNANNAYVFNGSNSWIEAPDNVSFHTSSFSVGAWVSYDAIPSSIQVLLAKSFLSTSWESNGIFYLYGAVNTIVSDGTNGFYFPATAPAAGDWFHILEVFDNETDLLKIYANGILIGSANTALSPVYDGGPFTMGMELEYGIPSFFFNGKLDDVRYYNRALSATEAMLLYFETGIEICNGIDDDCDGLIDDADPDITGQDVWFADNDEDGYGDPESSIMACNQPSGYAANGDDCDDADAGVNPGATEVCNETDDNCNGQIDESVQTTYYQDFDQDGYGNPNATLLACTLPPGYVAIADDCDDSNGAINPNAIEVCNLVDDDCDGLIDEGVQTVFYEDLDSDGFGDINSTALGCTPPTGFVSDADDCDDANASIHPGAAESCNEVDDDCDGVVDDGVQLTFYADGDSDGYGNAGSTVLACTTPSGFVDNALDCNDADEDVFPGALEVCNMIDDDCDGSIDEEVLIAFYEDIDDDGFGDAVSMTLACSAPEGFVANDEDCDDTESSIYPGAPETCNLQDDDCDGEVDEGVQNTYYMDSDQDSYGDANVFLLACSLPAGYVANDDDCNDANAAIFPGATEICNEQDDDCDGLVDEGVLIVFYTDADNDGYGDLNSTIEACSPPSGYVANGEDCDDANADIHPGARELCNEIDDDCNGEVDEDVQSLFYADLDGDGFGDPGNTILDCGRPLGYVLNNQDCDDTNADIHPGSSEVCNLLDDDCDGQIDEGVQITYYQDADNDSYGNASATVLACSQPPGYVLNNQDCDDTNQAINPGMNEVCNLVDDDCDGLIDELGQTLFYFDQDLDGYGDPGNLILACSAPEGYVDNDIDCDDTNPAIFPGAIEFCNSVDDDCDGQVDESFDTDGDGYSPCSGDCDDADPAVYPGALEICNNVDDDCDGLVDDGVLDSDGDGICDTFDNCPYTFNPDQADNENDGLGDVCDPNDDNDPSPDLNDCAPFDPTVYPGAPEICGDLIDNNCNNKIDDPLDIHVLIEQDVLCYGEATGMISVTGECGLPPYSYHWSNGSQAPSITNLVPGQYKLTVTDAQGLVRKKTFKIKQPSAIVLSITKKNVSCNGADDGTATANVYGGNKPYTYFWSNAGTTKTISGLPPGMYTVTVSDENGCSRTGSVTVLEPLELQIDDILVYYSWRYDYVVTIYATGGTPYFNQYYPFYPYRYSICNEDGTDCTLWRSSNVFRYIEPGIYFVKVRDFNGCIAQEVIEVGNNNNISQALDLSPWDSNINLPVHEIAQESSMVSDELSLHDFIMYPNPGKDVLTFQWTSENAEFVCITMRDLSGRIVLVERRPCITGKNNAVIHTAALGHGAYLVEFKTQGSSYSKLWIKTE